MKLEKNDKTLLSLKFILSLAFVVGLHFLNACPWDERPMKCFWCLTSLRISSVALLLNIILSFSLESLEGKTFANEVSIILTSVPLSIIFLIGVCGTNMVCVKIKQITLGFSIALFVMEIIHFYIIGQIKKYSLED